MIRKLVIGALFASIASNAAAEGLVFMNGGGVAGDMYRKAFSEPFEKATGLRVSTSEIGDAAQAVKVMVAAGNTTADVAALQDSDLVRLCDEGALEKFDLSTLPKAADGTPIEDDFLPGTLNSECGFPIMVWSFIYAYDASRYPSDPPTKIADLFDLKKYPGKRGMNKYPLATLEMALMADGVPTAEVYDVLSTPAGVDRAFAKLDTIKSSIVWWEAGAQAPQLLADGEVAMTMAYNGRIFGASMEGKPFKTVWDGQIYSLDGLAIPKGARNADAARKYLAFLADPKVMANMTKYLSYGPSRKSAMAEVGFYKDGKTQMAPFLPTAAQNMENSLQSSWEFWADHGAEISERFNAWIVK